MGHWTTPGRAEINRGNLRELQMLFDKSRAIQAVNVIMEYLKIPKNHVNTEAVLSQLRLSRKEYRNTLSPNDRVINERVATRGSQTSNPVRANLADPVVQLIMKTIYYKKPLNAQERAMLRSKGILV